jgi:glycine betaine/proline transport system ATP-binding protein
VGLARAFATEAGVLLMDEPFSALDPLIRTRLQDELLSLQSRVKKTILFVTHDLDEAMRLGNQISMLEGGRIVQTGSPQAIVSQPANEYVAAFVRHMNPLAMLTGAMVMRSIEQCERDAAAYWIDSERRTRASTDAEGRLTSVMNDANAMQIWNTQESASRPAGAAIAVVGPQNSLQSIVQLLNVTGHPVLVAEDGRLLGSCSSREIVTALGRHRTHEASSTA